MNRFDSFHCTYDSTAAWPFTASAWIGRNETKSETDWDGVLVFKEGDPIPYEPEDGPYDPNDADATRAWFAQADLIRKGQVVRRGKRGPQKTPTTRLRSCGE